MNALVFIEFNGSEIKKSSLEALSAAKGSTIMTCAVGAGSDQLAGELGKWGSSKHFSCTDEKANTYNPEVYQTFLTKVFEQASPQLVVASSNNVGRDVFPRLAAKFDMAYHE